MIRQFLPILLVLFAACHPVTTDPTQGSSGKIGEFSFERSADGSTTRFLKSGHILGRYDVFFLLGHDQEKNTEHGRDFRKLFNESIASINLPQGQNGIALKTPIFTKDTQTLPFYYVAIPENFAHKAQDTFKNYLSHCPIKLNGSDDRSTEYNDNYVKTLGLIDGTLVEHKNGDTKKDVDGVVYFYNPKKSNQLISPCPFNKDINSSDNNDLVNIYSYAKRLNDKVDADHENRLQSLWFAVGAGVLDLFAAKENVFLSTEGHAVNYLHIRLQKNPTYYESVPELKEKGSSETYYSSKFPK